MDYEDPKKGFELIHYRSFPPYIQVKCSKCGEKQLLSIRVKHESFDDIEIQKELKKTE